MKSGKKSRLRESKKKKEEASIRDKEVRERYANVH